MQLNNFSHEEMARLINESPKQFCDGFFIGHSKGGMFFFILQNGDESTGFVTSASQMKLIMRAINTNMELYEKTYGPINDIKPQEPILSPIQFDRPPENGTDFLEGGEI